MDLSLLVGRGAEPSCSLNPMIANQALPFPGKPGPAIVFMGPVRSFFADRHDVLVWPQNTPARWKQTPVDGRPHRVGHG
jgi:hypothetical protein